MRFLIVIGIAAGLFSASPWAAEPSVSAFPPLSAVGEGALKKNVAFWVSIYTQYDTSQGVIHDAKYIDLIYEIVDLKAAGGNSTRFVRNAKKRWKETLLSVHRKQARPESMTADELKVVELFKNVNEPNKYLNAAHRKRLRFQLGQKDRFREGWIESGRYLPQMEAIFKARGLPIELTRLPFVESSFNTHARSKVGASGIWQFMRSTGRLFLKIGDAVDERNDPIRATEAAAELLRLNFESLGNWPLAVTAYNHGRMGMMRAVRKVGSESLEEIITGYRSRSFGFASGNFYACLLAAIEVERNAEKHFGKMEREKPLGSYEVPLPDYVPIRELVRFLKLDLGRLRDLNPALTPAVLNGSRWIPKGYRLRLPLDAQANPVGKDAGDSAAKLFMAGYEEIPRAYKSRSQKFLKATYATD